MFFMLSCYSTTKDVWTCAHAMSYTCDWANRERTNQLMSHLQSSVLQCSMSQPSECHMYVCFDFDRIALQHTPSPLILVE